MGVRGYILLFRITFSSHGQLAQHGQPERDYQKVVGPEPILQQQPFMHRPLRSNHLRIIDAAWICRSSAQPANVVAPVNRTDAASHFVQSPPIICVHPTFAVVVPTLNFVLVLVFLRTPGVLLPEAPPLCGDRPALHKYCSNVRATIGIYPYVPTRCT